MPFQKRTAEEVEAHALRERAAWLEASKERVREALRFARVARLQAWTPDEVDSYHHMQRFLRDLSELSRDYGYVLQADQRDYDGYQIEIAAMTDAQCGGHYEYSDCTGLEFKP